MQKIRVRFAPSPTGYMHVGNVRTAELNYLFAKKNKGTFILRIEDTDTQRNVDPQGTRLIEDLQWLGLSFDEGPGKEGSCGPYFQSERTALYQKQLAFLEKQGLIYRCFCSAEELEKKRQRQIALKQPPRYDRTCLHLSEADVAQRLTDNIPFIWRLKTTAESSISFKDMAHGTLTFHLKDFSDIPLTRSDGSFTFLFSNCVDDIDMRITHIVRGGDHITNTASQVVMYHAFGAPVPIFWHTPIMCNVSGKKLSKRDFGFSLGDLRDAGFLPEAICNYLGIIGGSYANEVMYLDELAQAINFEHLSSSDVKYDVEKLRWLNHQWITKLSDKECAQRIRPFLTTRFPDAATVSDEHLSTLVHAIKTDLVMLADSATLLAFYFQAPAVSHAQLEELLGQRRAMVLDCIKTVLASTPDCTTFVQQLKTEGKAAGLAVKDLMQATRLLITGVAQGLELHALCSIFSFDEIKKRVTNAMR